MLGNRPPTPVSEAAIQLHRRKPRLFLNHLMKLSPFLSVGFAAFLLSGCAATDCPYCKVDKPAATTASPGAKPTGAASAVRSLFDGKSLTGWKDSGFAGAGETKLEPNFRGQGPVILIEAGQSLSGITFTNPVPKQNFEITLEALKVQGNDFFIGLTFPVGAAHATLVLGGWGGATTGISSIDGLDASENDTTKFLAYDKDKWFRIRMKVTPAKLETWIENDKVVDQELKDRRVSMRFGEIENSIPFGLATYQTTTVIRKVEIKPLE
ncbi:MAG: DUF1080 domain-containing protein [Verrucomicrobia bacterium]|nr:DUF1080 domain-containing protein [Verrucomicrobiota bacterium]